MCALEPTPESENFIEAVAKQKRVIDNLYLLGVNYMNLTFKIIRPDLEHWIIGMDT